MTIPTAAERTVESILNDVKEAIFRRATAHAKGETLTTDDIEIACYYLFCRGGWPLDMEQRFRNAKWRVG